MYDLNQIPYNYTGEVRNRFQGLDLINTAPDELWTEVRDIVQETEIKNIPKKKKCKKAKWLSEEALQIAVKRGEVKSKGEKERFNHLNAEFQRIARRDKKAFFSDQCKKIVESNRKGKTGEGNGTPLQYCCLENPMDGGAWQAAVHGVAKSRARLSDFTFTFHFHASEKEMATHSSVLAWRIPGTEEPGGPQRVEHD